MGCVGVYLWIAIQNYRYWIVENFDLQQLFSTALMMASLVFVLSAVLMMLKKGGVSQQRWDHTLLGFEKMTIWIEPGIFGLSATPCTARCHFWRGEFC